MDRVTWYVRAATAADAAGALRAAGMRGVAMAPAWKWPWCPVWVVRQAATDPLDALAAAHPAGVLRHERFDDWVRVDLVRAGERWVLGGGGAPDRAVVEALVGWGWIDARDVPQLVGRPLGATEWRDVLRLPLPSATEGVLWGASGDLRGAVVVGVPLLEPDP